MDVTCASCGRHFAIDETIADETKVARCICGSRLHLVTLGALSGTGQRLGKYVLLRRIAVGGMGEIFYAKMGGVEGFAREVAIKKMLPHLSADRNFVEMMIKEAKLTVLLNHPNIVQVYDLAREGKEYYIAMEYVPGTNVGHVLETCHQNDTHLPMEVAVYITMQVLRGLGYAHDLRSPDGELMHLLHRDITPQNILVTPKGWVKITDFGIAKARNEISTTTPGMIKGKLGYIAPEQLVGGAADQRIDLFCAGILLWEALATRRLFKGADEIDTFRLISEAKVPPLARERRDVSPELDAVLAKALAKSPDDRYPRADAFYAALNKAIYPRTIDDFEAVAKRYFAEHSEFFGTPDALPDDGDGAATSVVDLAGVRTEELRPIQELVEPTTAKRANVRSWLLGAGGVALVAVLGLVGYLMMAPAESGGTIGDPGSGTPEPNAMTSEEVQLAVDAERGRLIDCYTKGAPGLRALEALSAKLVVASTGGIASVELASDEATLGKAQRCLIDAIQELRLRAHGAASFTTEVTLPSPKRTMPAPNTPAHNVQQRDPVPDGGGGGTAPLTAAEVQATVRRTSGAIVTCLRSMQNTKAPPELAAKFTIEPNGKIADVELVPGLGDEKAEACIARALKGMRFRKHPQKDFRVSMPLKFQVL